MGGSTPSKDRTDFWGGEVPWVSPKDMKVETITDSLDHVTEAALSEANLRYAPLGSVLMVVRGMILAHTVPLALTDALVTLNQDMKALVPGPGVSGLFLRYCLQAHQGRLLALVEEAGHGTRCLRSERWRKFEVPVPPLSTQKAIADFLDRKTAAIDALIEKKQKLLDLLAEKRAALINQAVTKGLDPTAPMKDSGIPWIGEIPAHWQLRRIASVSTKITNGYVGPTRDLFVEHGVPYLQSLHIKDNQIRFKPQYYVPTEWSRQKAKSVLAEGDVLVVQTGDIGQAAVVPREWSRANCHALIIITTVKGELSGGFLAWALNSPFGFASLKSIQTGALHPHLNCGLVRELAVPCPPLQEQEQIGSRLDHVVERDRTHRNMVNLHIERLREYRQAVITAAVTGQLEIPEAA